MKFINCKYKYILACSFIVLYIIGIYILVEDEVTFSVHFLFVYMVLWVFKGKVCIFFLLTPFTFFFFILVLNVYYVPS